MVERVETGDELRSALARSTPDLVLSDYSLPTLTGLAALAIVWALRPNIKRLINGTEPKAPKLEV